METASEAYAARFAGPAGAWLLQVQAERALALIRAEEPGPLSVLDVGGGHGQLLDPLRAAGHRVVVHGSRPICHAQLRPHAPGVPRVVSGLWTLPFPDARFDLVVGIRLLAHVERFEALLAEMARVTRGLVLVDFPVRSALHRLAPALFGAKRQLEHNTRPYFDYELEEVEAAFARAGCSRAGVARQFGLPMALHRALGAPALSRGLEGLLAATGFTGRAGSPMLFLARRSGAPRTQGG